MSQQVVCVRGIGAATAAVLAEHGIQSVEDLAAASVTELLVIPGFSNVRATQAIENAKAMLPAPEPARKAASAAADKKTAKKTKKKDVKMKKKKKKEKKKPVAKEKEKKKGKKKAKAKKMNS